jgi:hypothetical protein
MEQLNQSAKPNRTTPPAAVKQNPVIKTISGEHQPYYNKKVPSYPDLVSGGTLGESSTSSAYPRHIVMNSDDAEVTHKIELSESDDHDHKEEEHKGPVEEGY